MVAESYSPTPPAHSITWKPTLRDTTSKYFFVRVWNAGGGDAPKADPDKPVAWLAPVWTGAVSEIARRVPRGDQKDHRCWSQRAVQAWVMVLGVVKSGTFWFLSGS